ncbi:DUF1801 domain-containing protein [Ideonella paludis]|uniref:DUF1801 domain-containing protein n=1 Tax=Ideonella paludis TaxID=1233411 RepID=A0ABS5E0X0_9BURK|nr:DUF1801 domain-containing protein [Ideonella paludis]MBQ0937060.1 DUF1801 domain-containing protein [Ideonella paludis]
MRRTIRPKALAAAWFDFLTPEQRKTAQELQAVVMRVEPELVEMVQWGQIVYHLDRVPTLALAAHKSHVSLQCLPRIALPAALGPLEMGGRSARSLKFRLHLPADPVLAEMLASAAVAAARRQLEEGAPTGEAGL